MVLLKVAEQAGVRAAVSAVMCVRCNGLHGVVARAPSCRRCGDASRGSDGGTEP